MAPSKLAKMGQRPAKIDASVYGASVHRQPATIMEAASDIDRETKKTGHNNQPADVISPDHTYP